MEIRRMLRGENVSFTPPQPPRGKEEKKTGGGRPNADRLELSRQWVEAMEEQRGQSEARLLSGAKEEKDGILGMLDEPSAEEEELEALSEQLKVQQRCMEIARRMMAGKRVPPQDERYLMENDPKGYKLVIALRKPPKRDEKECESVLKDDEKQSSDETAETEGTASAEGGEASSGGGDASSSSGE